MFNNIEEVDFSETGFGFLKLSKGGHSSKCGIFIDFRDYTKLEALRKWICFQGLS